jgi:hypothetical protein
MGSNGGTRFDGGNRGGRNWAGRQGGNWSGGHWRGRHFRGGPAFGFGWGVPYYYDYGYADCYDWRQVRTRYGWRWVQVNVCAY